jgi:phosphoribosylformimino-5-aminoimidazole carboxamide ribotide isomerase
MRLIPVIDLLDGQVVHAIKGERKHYRPVQSILCDASDPISIARAFRDRLGLNEIYIADLSALLSSGQNNHREIIATLAEKEGINILLDAGTSNAEEALAWLKLGVRKVIVGSETLRTEASLEEMPTSLDPDRLIFSLDFRAGKIMSQCTALTLMPPLEVLALLHSSAWKEVILLDLRRVGSGEGADRSIAAKVRSNLPDLKLLIGGGIANSEELFELESMGISGVLAATALHQGIITAEHISSLKLRH